MVSTDWKRKGLDRLLRALALARARGLEATLRSSGPPAKSCRRSSPTKRGFSGWVESRKTSRAERFLREVADADVGCILARYEAGGSVLREYHALGLAALATTAGGMPDFMFPEATVTVTPTPRTSRLPPALLTLRDRARVDSLRRAAWQRRHDARWEATVQRLRAAMEK